MPNITPNDNTRVNEDAISFCPSNQVVIFDCCNHGKKNNIALSMKKIIPNIGSRLIPNATFSFLFIIVRFNVKNTHKGYISTPLVRYKT